MQVDFFKDVLVPVVGGLGIFMLGLEFMADGIQAMAVNRMRSTLARVAGTPIRGLLAGTLITGVIQSSTAMTVMVVGLVNAGVLALRPAIGVIMGANIGTTLTNALIALPLGLWGLLFAGVFALVMVFSKSEATRNLCLALLGFSLIFYGLAMMTGGLRPLRSMPEVMTVISGLRADSRAGVLYCIVVAAGITAFIHSSSATIGIVMGLGSSGVLDWETALAFSLGADLGTTITSFIASLNLTRNAKRAAYAHIAFNFIGVAVMFPLFPAATRFVAWLVGDPSVPTMVDGAATYPLVPVAVGVYSILFNVFNTALLFPFVGTFERLLSRIGHRAAEDLEDFSVPRFIGPEPGGDAAADLAAIRREIARHSWAAALFVHVARRRPGAPDDLAQHHVAVDVLSRDIRRFAATLLDRDLPHAQGALVASLIAEADFTAALAEVLYQTARRVLREELSARGRDLVHAILDRMEVALEALDPEPLQPAAVTVAELRRELPELRERALGLDPSARPGQRGAILALVGSAERAYLLIERIDAERRSPTRGGASAPSARPLSPDGES
ncbi:MAG: Na/Pi cotransporter family protein [Alphaproteobacteria bacterium]|nr:Na/Pi cotransporter family protein [Alphaproteobacteria bacterium]